MNNTENKNISEMKQSFLSSAISDISSCIQLIDTKVSIIMASMLALVATVATCYEAIYNAMKKICPCSWIGVFIIILIMCFTLSFGAVFVFGILTLRGHVSNTGYKSKWFIIQPTSTYSFDQYRSDIKKMNEEEIINNMAAELYKLNDINRQKLKTNKWALRSFASTLVLGSIICVTLAIYSFAE